MSTITTNFHRHGWLALVCVLLVQASPASASTSWTFGRRTDEQLQALTRALHKKQASYSHLEKEPAFVLLKSSIWDVDRDSHDVIFNELVRVSDPEYEAASTRELMISSDADIRYSAAWIQRGKKIIRLDDDVWKIVKGDDDKATSIIIAFPDVKKGDILGWSLEQHCGWFWSGQYIRMADDLPVMMCRTRIKTDGFVAYKTIGEHLRRDKWSKKILAKSHLAPSDIRITVVDIPRHPEGRYAPNMLEFEPYLNVDFRGGYNKRAERWIFNVSWNEVAIWTSGMIENIGKKSGTLTADARRITAGYSSPREKVDALDRFIRDEIVTVSPFLVRTRNRDFKETLDARQATSRMKSMLLYAMCRSLGLDVDLLASRNQFNGSIDKANPLFGQLTDLVVRLNDTPSAYFLPASRHCAPGELPPGLRGALAFEVPRGVKDRQEEIQRQAFDNVGDNPTLFWDEYCRLIKQEKLAQWIHLPGNPDEVMGVAQETVICDPEQETMDVTFQAQGFSDLQFDLSHRSDTDELLTDYLQTRFGDCTVATSALSSAASSGETASLTGTATVAPLPAAMGDNWIIPGELVFGKVFLHDWDTEGGEPFIDRIVEDFRYTWQAPLPAGWQGAALPGEFVVNNPQFSYLCRFRVKEGNLVVSREIRLQRKLTMYSDVPAFAAEVTKVQGFEQSPVIISRK